MEKITGGQRPQGEIDALFMGLYGLEGTGKTTLGLSLPGPIMFVNCDRPAGQLIAQLPPDKEIYYQQLTADADILSPSAANGLLLQFDAAIRTAIGQCKSLFIDGEDRLLEIVRIAKLPANNPDPMPREYADANSYFENHYGRAAASGLQIVISSGARAVWTGAKTKTDYQDREGYKGTRGWMNVELFCYCPEWTLPQSSMGVEAGVGFVQNVTGNSQRTHWQRFVTSKVPGKEGLIGTNWQDLTFDKVYKLVYGVDFSPPVEVTSAPTANSN